MRDWFATLRKPRATWATRATTGLTDCDRPLFLSPDEVVRLGNRRATGATSQPAEEGSPPTVARVAHGLPTAPGGRATVETQENCGFWAPVARVAQVAHENRAGSREALADDWDKEDWLAFFDERAGIGEHDGGLSRADAEARAYEGCIAEWMNRNPVPSDTDRCAWCRNADNVSSQVVPFGAQEYGHTWLHSSYWSAWYAHRREQAIEALAVLGILLFGLKKDAE